MDLVTTWKNASDQWGSSAAPFVLTADAELLKSYPDVIYRTQEEAKKAPDFYAPSKDKDKRIHLGLLPGPFMGDVSNASIYVLMTNPGVTQNDYRELDDPYFRAAMLANLKQERVAGVLPFLFLDRQFDWHDGFGYWDRKVGIGKTIQEMAERQGITEAEARIEVGNQLAVIQLFPYHSANGPNSTERLKSLPSVIRVGRFVQETVTRRVRDRQAIAIVMRRVKVWDQYLPRDLSEEQGVFRSANAGEARRASLRPSSRGGRAILRHLGAAPQDLR